MSKDKNSTPPPPLTPADPKKLAGDVKDRLEDEAKQALPPQEIEIIVPEPITPGDPRQLGRTIQGLLRNFRPNLDTGNQQTLDRYIRLFSPAFVNTGLDRMPALPQRLYIYRNKTGMFINDVAHLCVAYWDYCTASSIGDEPREDDGTPTVQKDMFNELLAQVKALIYVMTHWPAMKLMPWGISGKGGAVAVMKWHNPLENEQ